MRAQFIDADADDLAAEQDRRHRVRQSRRARPAMIIWPAARKRENRSYPGCDRRPAAHSLDTRRTG
jgi:hypothetical protein